MAHGPLLEPQGGSALIGAAGHRYREFDGDGECDDDGVDKLGDDDDGDDGDDKLGDGDDDGYYEPGDGKGAHRFTRGAHLVALSDHAGPSASSP